MCEVCAELSPYIGEVCVKLEYISKSTKFALILEHKYLELMRVNFCAKATPELCIFGHFCGMATDMSLKEGAFCATYHFNGYPLVSDKCVKL